MESIKNSAFSKFEGNRFSNLTQILGGRKKWTPTHEQINQNGVCCDITDQWCDATGEIKRVKIVCE